ncbi:MAG: SgcJ/EcaC family oxidoreductase [Bryobacter sp.]|nr:SgcJ/EcaC family oxidoreductase [Bryobacter sp.]
MTTAQLMKYLLIYFFMATSVLNAIGQNGDEQAIKAMGTAWQDAWNRHDVDALTDLLAEDVDFVTVLGPKGWLKGKAIFKEAHTAMHKSLFTESVWATKATHVKFIRPDLATARVEWETTGDKVRQIKHGTPRFGIFTWVLEKQNGKWLIIASQNTEIMPPLPGQ